MVKKIISAISEKVNKSTLSLGIAFLSGLMLPILILLIWVLALSLQKPVEQAPVDEAAQEDLLGEAEKIAKSIKIPNHRYSTDNPPEVLKALYGKDELATYEMQPIETYNEVGGGIGGPAFTEEFYARLVSSPSCEVFKNKYVLPSGQFSWTNFGDAHWAYSGLEFSNNCFMVTDGENVLIADIKMGQAYEGLSYIGASILWIDEHSNAYYVHRRPFLEYELSLMDEVREDYPSADFGSGEWGLYAGKYRERLQGFFDNSGEVERALEGLKNEFVEILDVETENPGFKIRSNRVTEVEAYYFIDSDGIAHYLDDSQNLSKYGPDLATFLRNDYYISPNEEWAAFYVGLGEVSGIYLYNLKYTRSEYIPQHYPEGGWETIPGAGWEGVEWLDDGRFYIGSAQCMIGSLGDDDFGLEDCGSFVSIASGAPWKMKKLESPLE